MRNLLNKCTYIAFWLSLHLTGADSCAAAGVTDNALLRHVTGRWRHECSLPVALDGWSWWVQTLNNTGSGFREPGNRRKTLSSGGGLVAVTLPEGGWLFHRVRTAGNFPGISGMAPIQPSCRCVLRIRGLVCDRECEVSFSTNGVFMSLYVPARSETWPHQI